MNREGLTFENWLGAARFAASDGSLGTVWGQRYNWRQGICPTDYGLAVKKLREDSARRRNNTKSVD